MIHTVGNRCRLLLLAGLCAALPVIAQAEPWMTSGDVRLRHDLQQLSDAGLLTGPVMSWPIGWSHVAAEITELDPAGLTRGQLAAVARLHERATREMRTAGISLTAGLSLAANPDELRTFEHTPREDVEASVSAAWLGERFAWNLSATVVTDPDDDQAVRPDGSYVAMSLGNWMLSAGYLERWWGPGWEGSLVLSTNARPIPAVAIDRNVPESFDLPVLRWLGPWRLSTFMGQLESDRDYSHTLLFGFRTEFRPHPNLQIAATRTAQWCGDDRPCGLDTFWDLWIGNDNDQDLSEQPGNQLAGFDVRWSWPQGRVPIAFYAQGIGEDEAGFMPSKYLGLFGAEAWGEIGDGSWRVHAEYADTACDFLNSEPEFGCAYTNVIYTSGYRYRGRAIGHSIDADGESIDAGVMFFDARGHRWELMGRDVKLNRAGMAPGHSLASGAAQVRDYSLAHERAYAWGNITLSVGYSDVESGTDVLLADGVRGFLTWRHHLR